MTGSIGTLWTTDYQPGGKKIRAVAAFAGLELDIAKDYTHMETNKTEAFRSKFASGKIPAFETPDGFLLFESQAILRYVASLAPNSNLLGTNAHEAALVDQWMCFTEAEIMVPLGASVRLSMGSLQPYNKPIDTHFREHGLKSLDVIEKHLSSRTFLVTERITVADINLAINLVGGYHRILDAEHRKTHPNLLRFFNTVINHPKIKALFDEITFCEKAIQYTPPAKPAKEKEAKAPAPPAAKKEKEAKPKKEDDDEDEDDAIKEEPKAKNPLDSLPKSDFNLEDWKRAYSNKDTRGTDGAIEWFYSKFDKEGFSVWRVDFKYNEELTQVFMSSNQITGFFNRLEASRKYLFGSVGVLGTANNSVISGVFICRGKDIKPVVDVAPDYESYNYKELDLGNSKDKEFFEAALAWDLEEGNKKWADGKAFK